MDADLDTLCTLIYVTADDLLPEAKDNARRRCTDAEIVTLCVAQAIMGIASDRVFLAVARKRLIHLFPDLPRQAGYHKRRRRLAEAIEWLLGVFAGDCPGAHDRLLLIDSTPVECARSRETVKRSALAEAAEYGWCGSHSRYFWGFRLHLLAGWTARREQSSWPRPSAMSAPWPCRCLSVRRAAVARCCSPTRATPGPRSRPQRRR